LNAERRGGTRGVREAREERSEKGGGGEEARETSRRGVLVFLPHGDLFRFFLTFFQKYLPRPGPFRIALSKVNGEIDKWSESVINLQKITKLGDIILKVKELQDQPIGYLEVKIIQVFFFPGGRIGVWNFFARVDGLQKIKLRIQVFLFPGGRIGV
jgi:hypothetical protein